MGIRRRDCLNNDGGGSGGAIGGPTAWVIRTGLNATCTFFVNPLEIKFTGKKIKGTRCGGFGNIGVTVDDVEVDAIFGNWKL